MSGVANTTNNSPLHHHINTPAKVLQNYNNRAIRARHKSNDRAIAQTVTMTASPQLQGYSKLNSSVPHHHHHHPKLNTTALSQLNPQLTPEQKFSRTINHVEKWLTERDHVLTKTNNTDQRVIKFGDDTLAKDEKNLDNLINTKMFVDKLKMTEKFTEKFTESPVKKTFNKEVLLARRAPIASSTPTKSQRSQNSRQASVGIVADAMKEKRPVMEYASVPIAVEPSECENLLRASCSDDSASCSQAAPETSSSAVHRYVHEHIHHHYHHFENSGEIL